MIDEEQVDDSTDVDFLPISTDDLFYSLWGIGLFEKINRACGTLIDDYESEWLPHDQLPAARTVVNALIRQCPNGDVGEFLRRLSALIDRASGMQLPLYFEC